MSGDTRNSALLAEVERIAHAVKDQWLIKGDSPATSWVIWREYLQGGLGISHGVTRSLEVISKMPEHLRVHMHTQVGGQTRKVLCVRLQGGFAMALMAINPNRVSEERRQLLWACKEHLADLITDLVFGTGDGQRPASAFRALHGEMTGYTLPMFPVDAPVEEVVIERFDVDQRPKLLDPHDPMLTLAEFEALRQAEDGRDRGGSYDGLDFAALSGLSLVTTEQLMATILELQRVVSAHGLTLEQIGVDLEAVRLAQKSHFTAQIQTNDTLVETLDQLGALVRERPVLPAHEIARRMRTPNLTHCICGSGERRHAHRSPHPKACPVHQTTFCLFCGASKLIGERCPTPNCPNLDGV